MDCKWESDGYNFWRYYDTDTGRIVGVVTGVYHSYRAVACYGLHWLGDFGEYRTLEDAKRAVERTVSGSRDGAWAKQCGL